MATYVVRIARSAGLIALFMIAALLGIATGVIFAYARRRAADLGARRLRAKHHQPRLRSRRRGRRRIRHSAARGDSLRRHLPEAPAGDHRRGGLRVRAALRAEHAPYPHGGDARCARRDPRQDHRTALATQGRKHDYAAAGPRPVSGGCRVPDGRREPRTQDQGSARRRSDREALHQARDLHALREPDVPRRGRLRRRSCRAHLLRQVGAAI